MILFLKPYFETKPWAGKELNKIYDCPESTGEAWIVSGYKNKSSIIKNGPYKGQTLRSLWRNHPELFGDFSDREFPLLIKLISSSDDLSIQVHPNDDYALKKYNQLGKFECWYILPETKSKEVILGVNCKNSLELKEIIDKNEIEKYIIKKEIKPNDLVIVEPGTVHAIKGNTFLLEIQESSDLTYRLYDYNRFPLRELHIEDSLNVIDYNNYKNRIHDFSSVDTLKNPHFNLYKLKVNGKEILKNIGFELFYILEGTGKVNGTKISKGDSFILTNEKQCINVEGEFEAISVVAKPKDKERLKMRKTALITGIVGQDGYYLTKLLLEKNYEVHGIVQSKTQLMDSAIKEFLDDNNFYYHVSDMTDTSSLNRVLEKVRPDEVYHLASQSHVDLSFDMPDYTAQVNFLGTLRLLDAIKSSEIRTKFFNLSTPYLYSGEISPQTDDLAFDPKSPFAISKLAAFYTTKNYRDSDHLYAVNGICYNHTSKYRSGGFASKKIICGAKAYVSNQNKVLELGNLNSVREWGHALDYANAMWLSLQQEKPDDYIISTGIGMSVRDFTTKVFKHVGVDLDWQGVGYDEVAIDKKTGNVCVKVSAKFIRPTDSPSLVGKSTKFSKITGWKPKYTIDKLIDELLEETVC